MKTKERPSVESIEDFWCWLNTWGNLKDHNFTLSGQEAYRWCIRDTMKALSAAGVDFDNVPDETWNRWTGFEA